MEKLIQNDAALAVARVGEKNSAGMETITKRIVIKVETLTKMRKIVSLFDGEINVDAKEHELIGFFLEKGFAAIISSGEIDRRVKMILGE